MFDPKIWPVEVPKRGKWVNLPNFQSIGRKTLIFFPTSPFFAQLDSFFALSDTSENPLPPNLVPGGAKMVPKRGNMGQFRLTSKVLVVEHIFFPYTTIFRAAGLIFVLSENPLPQIWSLGVPKWVQKGVIWANVKSFPTPHYWPAELNLIYFIQSIASNMDPRCINLHITYKRRQKDPKWIVLSLDDKSYRKFTHITHFGTPRDQSWGQRIFEGVWKCQKWVQLHEKWWGRKRNERFTTNSLEVRENLLILPLLGPFWHPQGPHLGVTDFQRYLKVQKMSPAVR